MRASVVSFAVSAALGEAATLYSLATGESTTSLFLLSALGLSLQLGILVQVIIRRLTLE